MNSLTCSPTGAVPAVSGWLTAFSKGDIARGFSEMGEETVNLLAGDELGLLLDLVAPGSGRAVNLAGKAIKGAQMPAGAVPKGMDPNLYAMAMMMAQNRPPEPQPTPAWVWWAGGGGVALFLFVILLVFLLRE